MAVLHLLRVKLCKHVGEARNQQNQNKHLEEKTKCRQNHLGFYN